MEGHKCSYFSVNNDGVLVCADCGEPSQSSKWKANVFGKAVEQTETENKGFTAAPNTKETRGPKRKQKGVQA